MKNKGLTVVELIVSFALAIIIALFLLQIITILRHLYINSGTKTELLNKQAILTNLIYQDFNNSVVISITDCGSGCLRFSLDNLEIRELKVVGNNIRYGDPSALYSADFPDDTILGNLTIDFASSIASVGNNDTVLIIEIPVTHTSLDESFDIRIVYHFNSLERPLGDNF